MRNVQHVKMNIGMDVVHSNVVAQFFFVVFICGLKEEKKNLNKDFI